MPDLQRNVVIRAIEPEDYEALAAISNLPACQRETLKAPFRSKHEMKKMLADPSPNNIGVVAEKADGQIVGSANLIISTRPRRRHSGQIGMMVHDHHHGQGIGSALLGALIKQSDHWIGLKRLELSVYTDNARAIDLYQRFGFEIEGTFRSYALRDGIYVDAYSMARLRNVGS